MTTLRALFYVSLFLLGGCVTYLEVPPGSSTHAGLTVTTGSRWNQMPAGSNPTTRPDTVNWTLDGMLLNRLMIIPAVAPGESVFRQASGAQALPKFRQGMLPNEIQELVESSITKLFGEGGAIVETSGLRPQRFGNNRGFMFDLSVNVSDGPDYRGTTGALVVDERLYLLIYLAVKTYYYEKNLEEALGVIQSARIGGDNSTASLYGVTPSVATAGVLEDISGTYVSEITTNSKWQFLPKFKNLELRITQSGDQVTALDSRYDTRITGTFDGETISFRVDSNRVSGYYEARGEWRLREDSTGFDGQWKTRGGPDDGSGTWNLRRLR